MKRTVFLSLALVLIMTVIAAGCTPVQVEDQSASGTLSAVQVNVAPEVGGRILEVHVTEGDVVKTGDTLLTIDSEVLQAQFDQAEAARKVAEATVVAATNQQVYAQRQLDLALQGARAQEMEARIKAWDLDVTDDYRPSWYYQKSEQIRAANEEVDLANEDLDAKLANLKHELDSISNQDFIQIENRLNTAQIALTVAKETVEQAKTANDEQMTDASESLEKQAQAEFDSALMRYNSLLSSSAADNLLKARAEVAVAQARYDHALDMRTSLETGNESTQVAIAQAAVDQAASAIEQAKANLGQAEASISLLQLQLDKATVKATMDGTVLTRSVEPGELVGAGSVLMSIAKIDEMTLTVYVPEDRYGTISLGQKVNVSVDSFPSQRFSGTVVYISDQAEFTPRNVQSPGSRSATVYAVKITLDNTDGKLKPGMPADATF